MATLPYYNRLHLDILIEMLTYNPNTGLDVHGKGGEDFDTYESENLESPYQHTVQVLKDDADLEIIPDSLTGVKFMYLKVLTENLVNTPDNGTITIKVTSSGGGTDQILNGNLFMRRSVDADITSIKITNNEDDTAGVTLPVLVILGGTKT